MKTTKIIYWTTTILIVLFDGLIPALTSNTELARQGISHLQYPDYFRVMLTFFKVAGALTLILPFIKGRYKEWAYAGFGIDFICAAISLGCGWFRSAGYCTAGCICGTSHIVCFLQQVK